MLGHTIVGIVDNIMVGQIGPTELAAVSLGNSFFFIAMSLGIGFSSHNHWQQRLTGLIMLKEEEVYFIMDFFYARF
jgi:hypothetical protein